MKGQPARVDVVVTVSFCLTSFLIEILILFNFSLQKIYTYIEAVQLTFGDTLTLMSPPGTKDADLVSLISCGKYL